MALAHRLILITLSLGKLHDLAHGPLYLGWSPLFFFCVCVCVFWGEALFICEDNAVKGSCTEWDERM